MSFTVKQLKYFVATAELGQVSKSAKALFISQSAITTAIKEIETQLGNDIFIRNASGMNLTELGTILLPKARYLLQLLNDIEQTTTPENLHKGQLNIGVSYTVMGYFLPAYLQKFSQLYPNIKLNIIEETRQNNELKLIKGELDIAFLLTSNIYRDDLECESLLKSPRMLWVASQHPLLEKTNITLADVAQYPYVMLDVDESVDSSLRYWQTSKYLPNIALQTSSVESVRSLVANGYGVTILSDMVYRPWSLEGKKIEKIHLVDKIPEMEIGLTWSKSKSFSPEMTCLKDYFHHAINDGH